MAKYKVLSQVKMNKTLYAKGSEIEMDPKDAAPLIEEKILAAPGKDKPESEEKSESKGKGK